MLALSTPNNAVTVSIMVVVLLPHADQTLREAAQSKTIMQRLSFGRMVMRGCNILAR
jgi:hypothetical protein